MKIAIIGAGNVGQAIGSALSRAGHDVLYGVRDRTNPKYRGLDAASVMAPQEAASSASHVVLATPWQTTENVCHELGGFAGKVVIDCTNPLKMGADGLELAVGLNQSGGELVQSWCPKASVFKTFNQVGFEIMADAGKLPAKPVMFIAGDDSNAKPSVLNLARDTGFEAADAGPLKRARILEPYGLLWITLAMKQGLTRNFAFGLIHSTQTPNGETA
jgi:predicted dinucleotide-binding enzyme